MDRPFITLFEIANISRETLMMFSGYITLSIVGILIGLLSWRWLKDRVYLYFSTYLTSVLLIAIFGGFLVTSAPLSAQEMQTMRLSIFLAALVNVGHFLFIRSLISPQTKMPRLYKMLTAVLVLLILSDINTFINMDLASWNLRGKFLLLFTIINLIIQIIAAVKLPFIRWYVAGVIVFLFGNIPLIMLNAGAVKSLTPTTASLPFLAALIETLFFIIGLVDRLRYEYLRNLNELRIKMLGTVAAEVFHEIANPLTVISFSSNLLKKNILSLSFEDSNKKQILGINDNIEKNVQRISSNIQKFRNLSRVQETGTKNEKTLARDILDGSIELSKNRIEKRNCILNIDDDITPSIYLSCNKFDLEQVISNLIINCADAVQNLDDKWIRLKTSKQGDDLEIRITDSGKGIPKEVQDKIFNEFFTTKKPGEGTGLGLSICKRFVEIHGGTLELDKKSPNTCFVLRLPIYK